MAVTSNTMSSLEYVSLVASFATVPFQIHAYLRTVRDLLIDAVGNLPILAQRMDGEQARKTAFARSPTSITNEQSGLLSADWFVEWLRGTNDERLVLYSEDTPVRSKREFLMHIDYNPGPIDKGVKVEKYLVVSICLTWLEEHIATKLSRMCVSFANSSVTLANACSVLVDVGDIPETARGTIYVSRWPAYARFQRQVSRLVWVRAGEQRRNMARGVFWGNLLTTPMLAKLGGAENLISEYRKLEDPRDHDLCTILSDGSVWLTLSHSIKDVCHQSPGMTPNLLERAAWLWERLAQARLICGMQS